MSRVAAAGGAADGRPQAHATKLATAATLFVLLVVPLAWAAFYLTAAGAHESLAYDFRKAYLPAAEVVLDGRSPYPETDDPRLAAEIAYVYPPLLAYAVTPATTLSENAASVVATLVALALLLGTLLVLGNRDWRCYGAALLWAPTLNGLHMASSSLLLAFGAALAWRWASGVRPVGSDPWVDSRGASGVRPHRSDPWFAWPLGLSIGLSIAVKLVVWPLLVWTLATRRLRATIVAGAVAAGVTLTAWAALGFEDIARYPALLRRLAELEAEESYSLVAAGALLGLGESGAQAASLVIGAALLVACVVFGRRGDDFRSFTCAIAAALAFTPILWLHYLVLLLVPLGIARPRFSAIWLLPVILWYAPREDNGDGLQTLLPALVGAILVAAVLRRRDVVVTRTPVAESR